MTRAGRKPLYAFWTPRYWPAWLGLGLLRTAWFNLDWAWAAALVVTGIVVLLK